MRTASEHDKSQAETVIYIIREIPRYSIGFTRRSCKKRRPSIHVIDTTDASSNATVKDTHVSYFPASPSTAQTLSDSGTDGKTYRVYKTVFESRDAAAKNLYYVQKQYL